MSKILSEEKIRELIEREVEKKILELEPKKLITRGEFLKSMDLMDKRFEELITTMNQRFEAVDKRFEAVDKRFEELITTMNQRFRDSDRRTDELIASMNKGFMTLESSFSSLGGRSGVRLEKTILKLLQKILENRDIDINKIEKIELVDEEGLIFTRNYRTDIDVLIRDGVHFLMEIKYCADNRDIHHFLDAAKLYAKKNINPIKLLLLTLDITPRNMQYAIEQNIEVITGDYE